MPLEKPMLFGRTQAFKKQVPHLMKLGVPDILARYVIKIFHE